MGNGEDNERKREKKAKKKKKAMDVGRKFGGADETGGVGALTRTRRIRHLIHAPFSRTSAVCSGWCTCLFLLLLPEPLLDEIWERLRRLDCWGNDGGEGGCEDGGDEADEGGV